MSEQANENIEKKVSVRTKSFFILEILHYRWDCV